MIRKQLKIAAVVWLLMGLVGCGLGQPTHPGDQIPTKGPADPVPAKPIQITPLVQGNTQFGIDLYGKLRDRPGNLFLSPYSISTAFGMTYAGARNQTAEQMSKVLHFPVPQDKVGPAFAALIRETRPTKGYQLSVANALWCQTGYNFQKEFLATAEQDYQAGLQGVDFIKATEEARQTINAWVEKKTQDKIKELLKPGVLNVDTRLVLTNAIYFKGDWASKFKKEATKDEPFLTGGQKVLVPMMNQQARFGYLDGGTFQALEMPYVGKEVSMVVFLPKQTDGLAEFEKVLTADQLQEHIGKLRQQDVIVSLPRFKMTSEFKLNEELKALGMSDAFKSGVADFTGINPKKELYIQAVVHKAFVEVNEEGTEAAAATGVVIGIESAPVTPVFKADHPFLFVIRDLRNGSILFLGRLAKPEKG